MSSRPIYGVTPPPEGGKLDLWPGYMGPFIRRHPHADVGDEAVPPSEAMVGLFGLVPHLSTDIKITKSTFNCRSETAAIKPSFSDAYKRNQCCIIPANAIYVRMNERIGMDWTLPGKDSKSRDRYPNL